MSDVSTHATQFVLRSPLLPVDVFENWGTGLKASEGATEHDLEAAVAEDRAELRARLERRLADPKIQEAIYLAAPGLIDGLDRWRKEPESKAGQDVERSLVRYLTRMSCRATPFGLFSGLSLGSMADRIRAELGPDTSARRHVEFDADTLIALASAYVNSSEVRARGRLFSNTSLTRCDRAFRYTESSLGSDGWSYQLVSAPASDVLTAVVERAKVGASVAELVEVVQSAEPDVDQDDAREFLDELVDNDVLQPELRPGVTGPRPTRAIIDALRACAHPAAETLSDIEARIRALDDMRLGVPLSTYRDIATQLETLHGIEGRRCFHAQLHKHDDDLHLDGATLDAVIRTAETLDRISPVSDLLGAFKLEFVERYEDGERWVDLSEALDEERGFGFGATARDASPLLAGIPFGSVSGHGASSVDVMRLSLWQRALKEGQHEVAIGREELWSLAGVSKLAPPPGRQAFAVCFSLARGDVRDRPEIIYRWANGPSGARLLGRFAHGHPGVEALIREHVAIEEADSDAVYAEVAHLPEGRLANVVARPVLRSYEIPCLGRSGAPVDRQLPLADLQVCVAGNRVLLRSRRLRKRVIPRLSSAHNPSITTSSAYRFLCALQMQDGGVAAKWMWGALERVADFLPRLRIDGVVVSLAQWRLQHSELSALSSARTPSQRLRRLNDLRNARGLPRYVQYGEADVKMVVDLDNTLSVDAFVHALPKFGALLVQEWYPKPSDQFVRSPEGGLEAEYCVPIVRTSPGPSEVAPAPTSETGSQRVFPPGSSWSYLKLYGGPASSEIALTEHLAPALNALQSEGALERWFFIRYADPRPHLRLRIQGDPALLRERAERRILAHADRLRATGRLWKIELATYVREAERYGGEDAIGHVEDVFAADSRACARLLHIVGRDPEARWGATLLGLHDLIRAAGLDEDAALALTTRLAEGRLRMIDPARAASKPIARRYRELRATVERWLGRDVPVPILDALDARVLDLAPPLRQLSLLDRRGVLTRPFQTIVGDLLHMHANRMFRTNANTQESVLYEFLRRSYRSAAARRRAGVRVASGE